MLAGDWEPDRVALTSPAKNDELSFEWHLGTRATELNISESKVLLDSGHTIAFDGAIIATGARCISLRMAGDLQGIIHFAVSTTQWQSALNLRKHHTR